MAASTVTGYTVTVYTVTGYTMTVYMVTGYTMTVYTVTVSTATGYTMTDYTVTSYTMTVYTVTVYTVTVYIVVVITESMSVSSLLMMVRGANFPPIIAWKVSNTLGSFSFLRSNLSLVCFGLLILFMLRWKVIISKSWSLLMSAHGKLRVLAMFTPDRKRFLTRI